MKSPVREGLSPLYPSPGAPRLGSALFWIETPSQLDIEYHSLAFLNQVRKNL